MKHTVIFAFLLFTPCAMYCADDMEFGKKNCTEFLELAEENFKKSEYKTAFFLYGEALKHNLFAKLDSQQQVRAKVNLGETELALHKFKEGHTHFDARLENKDPKLNRKPLQKPWDGTFLHNSSLLQRHEHGIGDLFFAIRNAKKADELGIPVIVRAPGFLKPILSRQPYIKGVITSDKEEATTEYGADIYSLSLSRYISNNGLRSVQTTADIPYPHGYIEPRADLVEKWKNHFSKKQAFNIVIGAYRASANVAGECRFLQRDIAIAALIQKLAKPGVKLYYCSGGDHRPISCSEYNKLKAEGKLGKLDELDIVEDADMHKLEILEGENFDQTEGAFEGTAAAMCAADRVVSVDTSLAMLAGALGDNVKKFSVLLPKESDWRWGNGQPTTTPFFANATLFWQKEQNDWSVPLEALSVDVAQAVEAKE